MYGRLRSPISTTSTFKTTAAGTEYCGGFVKTQDTWGIAFNPTIALGSLITALLALITFYKAEKIEVPKSSAASGLAIAVGDYVYLHITNLNVSKTNGGADICVGICTEAATTADTLVEIELDSAMSDQA